MVWIILGALAVVFGSYPLLIAAGYLVQKYQFGNSFRDTYEYHKEQDALERETK
jgi:hypothetical protein